MRTKFYFLICTCLLAMVFLNNGLAQSTTKLDDQLQAALDQYRVDSYQYNTKFSLSAGMTMSVSLPGEKEAHTFYSGTTAMNSNGLVDDQSLFEIASVTKSFTSAIILKLEAAGAIKSINDPIKDYLQVCDDPTGKLCLTQQEMDAWGDISIKQVMNHTGGIPNITDNETLLNTMLVDPTKRWTPADLLQLVIGMKPREEGWYYSNTDYILLGMISRNLTHLSMQEAMETMLFEPLALTDTYYLPKSPADQDFPDKIRDRLLHGYTELFSDYVGYNYDATNVSLSYADAAGSIISNSRDLTTWIQALFGGNVLPKKQLDEMEGVVCMAGDDGYWGKACKPAGSSNVPIDAVAYGLGIARDYLGPDIGVVWWHGGDAPGFETLFMYSPKYNIVISVMSNVSSDYMFLSLCEKVFQTILNSPEWGFNTKKQKGLIRSMVSSLDN